MVHKIRMPKLDANVLEGSIGRWLKAVGEPVRAGEPLVEIITDKAAFELESKHRGFLRACLAPEKSVVPVGFVIALLSEDADEPLPDVRAENDETMKRHRETLLFGAAATGPPAGPHPAPGEAEGGAPGGSRPRATPAARRLARSKGVRLEDVEPGAGGVVREEDVTRHLRQRDGSQEGLRDAT